MAEIGAPQTWYKVVRAYDTLGGFMGINGESHFVYRTIEDAIEQECPTGDYFIEEVTIRIPRG